MIGHRVIFSFLPLFLTLVVTISTAPILDIQLVTTKLGESLAYETVPTTESTTYDDDNDDSKDSDEEDIQSTTVENSEETTSISELVSNGQLSADATDIPLDIDEILKLTDRILSENQDELPSTPTTESPEDSEDDE
jgi:hypothetical protein